MVDLTQHSELVVRREGMVRQERKKVEVFTSFETENKYSVQTPDGAKLLRAYYAYEKSGTFWRRFMGTHRPLSIHVFDGGGSPLWGSPPIIEASRDFYWLLEPHLRVSEGGRRVGTISRKFTVNDANDRALASLYREGSVFRPYTVARGAQGNEMGRITKQGEQWGSTWREMFTDADTFRVEFNQSAVGQDFRLLMLAAVFALCVGHDASSSGWVGGGSGLTFQ